MYMPHKDIPATGPQQADNSALHVNSHFETKAVEYSRFVAPCFQPTYDYICDYVARCAATSILDIASGDGCLASRLAIMAGRSIFGIDQSTSLVRIAANGSRGVSWLNADAHQLPFKDRSFDLVFCNLSLHLFSHPLNALYELRRVVREGGEILIGALGSVTITESEDPLQKSRLERLEYLLRLAGLKIVHREGLNAVVKIGNSETLANILEGEVRPAGGPASSSKCVTEMAQVLLHKHSGQVQLWFRFLMLHLVKCDMRPEFLNSQY